MDLEAIIIIPKYNKMIQMTITMKENELLRKNLKETSTSLNLKMASLV